MSTLASYIQSLNPTYWFRLDETSGNAINSGSDATAGTYNGTVSRNQTALNYNPDATEKAVNFAGTGYISVPHSAGTAIASPWSVFFRCKIAEYGGYLFQKGNNSDSGNQGVYFTSDTGVVTINFFNGSWRTGIVVGTLPANGTEFDLGLVYLGGTSFKGYINGVEVANLTLPAAILASTQSLCIGSLGGGDSPINATYDDFVWFNSALTAAQILMLHNASLGAPYNVKGTVLDSNGNPVNRTIRTYRRDTGILLASGQSSPVNGAYSLDTWFNGEVQVVLLDDALGTVENDQILRTVPV